MNSWSRAALISVLCSSVLTACTKETVIQKEVLPPAQIEASAQVSKNSIQFEKASLEKIFMLIPSSIGGSRNESFNFLRPLLISFQKIGNRMAVFNHTTQDIYEAKKSKQLMQSFTIISESADSITFDFEQGFRSIDLKESMDILLPGTYARNNYISENKMETYLNVKDSVVEHLSLRNNSIFIKQFVRVAKAFQNPFFKDGEKDDQFTVEAGMSTPQTVEVSQTLFFEIKPYVPNFTFDSELIDEKERYGFFVNRAYVKNQNDTRLQITRWSIAESAGPIRVLLDKNVPAKFEQAVTEGVLYWNKIFGRDVLKVETGYADTEPQSDRSIVIRWIQWDEGPGAFANFQGDPLTGELFRGHIYFTSTFTKEKNQEGELNGALAMKHGNLCNLDFSASTLGKKDTVRSVIAHEMGHVLGLRHNFAGSSAVESTDAQIPESIKKIRANDTSNLHPVSSTVMDYLLPDAETVNGILIKDRALTYDRDAIAWAYLGQEPFAQPHSYCSDEHIGEAAIAKRKILGCSRGDGFKNPFIGDREKFLIEANQVIANFIQRIPPTKKAGSDLTQPYSIYFSTPDLGAKDLLKKSEIKNQFLMIDQVVKQYFSPYMKWGISKKNWDTDYSAYEGEQYITQKLREAGGLNEYIRSLIPQESGQPQFFENQARATLAQTDLTKLGLSKQEIEALIVNIPAKAKELDESFPKTVRDNFEKSTLRENLPE